MLTLDRVGLGELGQVGQEFLWDIFPGIALTKAQVDVSAGQFVDVELIGISRCIARSASFMSSYPA